LPDMVLVTFTFIRYSTSVLYANKVSRKLQQSHNFCLLEGSDWLLMNSSV